MNRKTPFSTLKDRYGVFNNFPMGLKEKLSAFSFCFIYIIYIMSEFLQTEVFLPQAV